MPTKVPASPASSRLLSSAARTARVQMVTSVAVRPAWYGRAAAGAGTETVPEGFGPVAFVAYDRGTQVVNFGQPATTSTRGRATDAAAPSSAGLGRRPIGRWCVRPAAGSKHVDDGDETGPKTPGARAPGAEARRRSAPEQEYGVARPVGSRSPGAYPGSASRSRWRAGRSPVPADAAAGGRAAGMDLPYWGAGLLAEVTVGLSSWPSRDLTVGVGLAATWRHRHCAGVAPSRQ